MSAPAVTQHRMALLMLFEGLIFERSSFVPRSNCCPIWVDCCVATIRSMVSFASHALRRCGLCSETGCDTRLKPLVDLCPQLRFIIVRDFCCVRVEPKVLATIGRDRRCSRWHAPPPLSICPRHWPRCRPWVQTNGCSRDSGWIRWAVPIETAVALSPGSLAQWEL